MLSNFKVAHLTSVHTRFDTRIFIKECTSLANNGYSVALVVADGKGNETKNNVTIFDVGKSNGRLARIIKAPSRILEKALELNASIYHLHDPELIPIGIKLKKYGKVVIFDAHEDVPKQLLGKSYLPNSSKWLLSNMYSIYERWACGELDAVIAATPYIKKKYTAMGVKSIDINNYPLFGELSSAKSNWHNRKEQVVYVGGLERIRGIHELVKALRLTSPDVRLVMGGSFTDVTFEKSVKEEDSWQRVDHLGWLDRVGVKNVLNDSLAGLVTLHPIINYLDALPVKMFEYMDAGLPVIASDFPLWKSIIEGNECGLCVDPLNPNDIANAIDFLINHPAEAEKMGHNGQKAVKEKYNWCIEEQKLLKFYKSL